MSKEATKRPRDINQLAKHIVDSATLDSKIKSVSAGNKQDNFVQKTKKVK